MGVGGQRHAPATLPQGNRPDTHCIGGWLGPSAGLDGCGNSRPPPGFDPRTVQLAANRYTDCALPALTYRLIAAGYLHEGSRELCWLKTNCYPSVRAF